jgi:hypothetical protein
MSVAPSNKMPEQRAIAMHLSYQPPMNGIQVFSGFAAGLRDARKATGRDQGTGAKIDKGLVGSWIGAIGYMALLDQIGSCFKPKTATAVSENSITRVLTYFSALPRPEIDALYALRCAFAHDYSLYNINSKNPSLQHQFAVGIGGGMNVVGLPKSPWDGNYNHKAPDNRTIVNLEAFGDLVEDVVSKLTALAKSQGLEVVLQGGSDELLDRYSFFTQGP